MSAPAQAHEAASATWHVAPSAHPPRCRRYAELLARLYLATEESRACGSIPACEKCDRSSASGNCAPSTCCPMFPTCSVAQRTAKMQSQPLHWLLRKEAELLAAGRHSHPGSARIHPSVRPLESQTLRPFVHLVRHTPRKIWDSNWAFGREGRVAGDGEGARFGHPLPTPRWVTRLMVLLGSMQAALPPDLGLVRPCRTSSAVGLKCIELRDEIFLYTLSPETLSYTK